MSKEERYHDAMLDVLRELVKQVTRIADTVCPNIPEDTVLNPDYDPQGRHKSDLAFGDGPIT